MEIREAIPADAGRIHDIAVTSWLDTYAEIYSERSKAHFVQEAYPQEEVVRAIRTAEEARGEYFYVGIIDEEIVGFIHAIDVEGTWEIIRLYVLPKYQQNGIGRRLIRELERQGAVPLEVYVEARNYKARQFLISFGFEELSEMTEEVFGQVESVIRLRHVAS
ncbi:GNAT family N-acetyltransferase [Exiguobacterium sp. OS-77]|uniref:GNAT family N-acetyltransferase n=1 Tax=Exiguobacterium sp. OS-77 TaxID=1241306 RepID=UPI00041766BD|nr:GNAT family N-acetyltransferase [Exiguobacterium sp. OS-77]